MQSGQINGGLQIDPFLECLQTQRTCVKKETQQHRIYRNEFSKKRYSVVIITSG